MPPDAHRDGAEERGSRTSAAGSGGSSFVLAGLATSPSFRRAALPRQPDQAPPPPQWGSGSGRLPTPFSAAAQGTGGPRGPTGRSFDGSTWGSGPDAASLATAQGGWAGPGGEPGAAPAAAASAFPPPRLSGGAAGAHLLEAAALAALHAVELEPVQEGDSEGAVSSTPSTPTVAAAEEERGGGGGGNVSGDGGVGGGGSEAAGPSPRTSAASAAWRLLSAVAAGAGRRSLGSGPADASGGVEAGRGPRGSGAGGQEPAAGAPPARASQSQASDGVRVSGPGRMAATEDDHGAAPGADAPATGPASHAGASDDGGEAASGRLRQAWRRALALVGLGCSAPRYHVPAAAKQPHRAAAPVVASAALQLSDGTVLTSSHLAGLLGQLTQRRRRGTTAAQEREEEEEEEEEREEERRRLLGLAHAVLSRLPPSAPPAPAPGGEGGVQARRLALTVGQQEQLRAMEAREQQRRRQQLLAKVQLIVLSRQQQQLGAAPAAAPAPGPPDPRPQPGRASLRRRDAARAAQEVEAAQQPEEELQSVRRGSAAAPSGAAGAGGAQQQQQQQQSQRPKLVLQFKDGVVSLTPAAEEPPPQPTPPPPPPRASESGPSAGSRSLAAMRAGPQPGGGGAGPDPQLAAAGRRSLVHSSTSRLSPMAAARAVLASAAAPGGAPLVSQPSVPTGSFSTSRLSPAAAARAVLAVGQASASPTAAAGALPSPFRVSGAGELQGHAAERWSGWAVGAASSRSSVAAVAPGAEAGSLLSPRASRSTVLSGGWHLSPHSSSGPAAGASLTLALTEEEQRELQRMVKEDAARKRLPVRVPGRTQCRAHERRSARFDTHTSLTRCSSRAQEWQLDGSSDFYESVRQQRRQLSRVVPGGQSLKLRASGGATHSPAAPLPGALPRHPSAAIAAAAALAASAALATRHEPSLDSGKGGGGGGIRARSGDGLPTPAPAALPATSSWRARQPASLDIPLAQVVPAAAPPAAPTHAPAPFAVAATASSLPHAPERASEGEIQPHPSTPPHSGPFAPDAGPKSPFDDPTLPPPHHASDLDAELLLELPPRSSRPTPGSGRTTPSGGAATPARTSHTSTSAASAAAPAAARAPLQPSSSLGSTLSGGSSLPLVKLGSAASGGTAAAAAAGHGGVLTGTGTSGSGSGRSSATTTTTSATRSERGAVAMPLRDASGPGGGLRSMRSALRELREVGALPPSPPAPPPRESGAGGGGGGGGSAAAPAVLLPGTSSDPTAGVSVGRTAAAALGAASGGPQAVAAVALQMSSLHRLPAEGMASSAAAARASGSGSSRSAVQLPASSGAGATAAAAVAAPTVAARPRSSLQLPVGPPPAAAAAVGQVPAEVDVEQRRAPGGVQERGPPGPVAPAERLAGGASASAAPAAGRPVSGGAAGQEEVEEQRVGLLGVAVQLLEQNEALAHEMKVRAGLRHRRSGKRAAVQVVRVVL